MVHYTWLFAALLIGVIIGFWIGDPTSFRRRPLPPYPGQDTVGWTSTAPPTRPKDIR